MIQMKTFILLRKDNSKFLKGNRNINNIFKATNNQDSKNKIMILKLQKWVLGFCSVMKIL